MDATVRMLENLNPWWTDGLVPPELARIPRDLGPMLDPLLAAEEILTLVGVRRSGKSTILFQIINGLLKAGTAPGNILLVDFEDPRAEGLSVGDVMSSYRQHKNPSGRVYVLLDEVQTTAGWERWVRSEYERRRGVKFVVTGSSSSIVRGELARVLTGRTLTVPVHPLSFREYMRFRGVDPTTLSGDALVDKAQYHLGRYIETGGFPKSVLEGEATGSQRLREYYDAILYRDIVFRHGVRPKKVAKLATYLLSNIGTLQRDTALASSTNISTESVVDYLGYLEDANLIFKVEPLTFKTKPASTRVLPRKYYCVDTGLRNAVARRASPDTGWLVENVVCMEMVRRGLRPLYWMNKGEVDFILGGRPGALEPVNVCFSDEVPKREYDGLRSFAAHIPPPVGRPMLLTRSRDGVEAGVKHVPVWRWLLDAPSSEAKLKEGS